MHCEEGRFASLYDKIHVAANILDSIEIVLVRLLLLVIFKQLYNIFLKPNETRDVDFTLTSPNAASPR